MSVALFVQLLLTALIVAFYLFILDSNDLLSIASFAALCGSPTVLLPTFVYCKLSENVALDLEEIREAFYGCSWYCMRVSHQKWFLLPIQRAQQSFRMMGLGVLECSLGVFLSVNAI